MSQHVWSENLPKQEQNSQTTSRKLQFQQPTTSSTEVMHQTGIKEGPLNQPAEPI